jgi:oligopeptide/dipeptide ABC transporter ATP-binding protein
MSTGNSFVTAQPDPPATTAARPAAVRVDDVHIQIPGPAGLVRPVDGVSFELLQGEVLGIVGETGSGKTVTCRSLLGLMPAPNARHTGSISYPGVLEDNILDLGPKRLRRLWGSHISMIPQNPMTSLNPVHRIGDQIAEAVSAHASLSKAQCRDRVIELMTRVGIPVPERRLRDYPHQFSGGMLQRTLIAIALAGEPKVLIADEPTTALDVIIQDQILTLLLDLQRDTGMSLVMVSHDLSVISQVADRVGVMYAGQLVELSPTAELLGQPRHPYTAALLRSLPGAVARDQPLTTITGAPPRLIDLPASCRFADRCGFVEPACTEWHSELLPSSSGLVRCRRHAELTLIGAPAARSAGEQRPAGPSAPIVGHHADQDPGPRPGPNPDNPFSTDRSQR